MSPLGLSTYYLLLSTLANSASLYQILAIVKHGSLVEVEGNPGLGYNYKCQECNLTPDHLAVLFLRVSYLQSVTSLSLGL